MRVFSRRVANLRFNAVTTAATILRNQMTAGNCSSRPYRPPAHQESYLYGFRGKPGGGGGANVMLTEPARSTVLPHGGEILRASPEKPPSPHPSPLPSLKLLPSAIWSVCQETEALWVRGLWNTSSDRLCSLTSYSQN